MASNGIMQEIRSLLSQGKSAAAVIALGYKPPTVYKVQRQLRKQQAAGNLQAQTMKQEPPVSTQAAWKETSEPTEPYFEFWLGPEDEPAQSEDVQADTEQTRARIAELEQEAGQVQLLQQRVHELEGEAEAAADLRQRVRDLEAELEHANHTQAALRRSNVEWQIRFNAERAARMEAERRYDNALVIVP